MRNATVLLLLSLVPHLGCTATTTNVKYETPTYEHRLTRLPGVPLVTATDLKHSNGLLSGSIVPSAACRDVPTKITNGSVVETRTSDPGANVALMLVSAAVAVGAGAILNAAPTLSDEETCTESHYEDWKGDTQHRTSCSSPQEDATIAGLVGVLLGGGGVVAGIAGLTRKPTEHVVGPAAPIVEPQASSGPGVSCFGGRSLGGLVLSLESQGKVLDYAPITQAGTFRFTLQDNVEGTVDIVTSAVPPQFAGEIPVGQLVARYQLGTTS
jgi:hypothetical protein